VRSPTEIAVSVLVIALVGYLVWPKAKGVVSPEEAHRQVERGALLLDVRTPEEFAQGHLPGARNVPVQVLESRLAEVGDAASPVVVYCRSGARSARAKSILVRHGFVDVSDLGAMSRY